MPTSAASTEVPEHGAAVGHEANHGTTHGAGHPSINWWSWAKAKEHGAPLGFVLVNFTLLLVLLVRFVRRPLLSYLAERHDRVSSDIEEASRLHQAARDRLSEIENRLMNLDEEIENIRRTAAEQAEADKRRVIESAEREVAQIIAGADRAVQQEVDRAKRTLEAAAISAGVDAARQLLRSVLTDEDRSRLHREYVEQIRLAGGRS